MVAAIDIHTHPDFFYCDRLKVTMKREHCVNYQAQAALAAAGSQEMKQLWTERTYTCLKCQQGEAVKKALKGGKSKMVTDSSSKKLKYPCVKCGEREAVVGKKTGLPTHHMCSVCFGEKIRAAWQKKRDEGFKQVPPARPDKPDDGGPVMCKVCGERPVIVDKQGQAMAHRMCNPCFTKSLRQTKERKARVIQIDLGEHDSIFDWVKKRADDQLRTIENQVLWDLMQFMKG
jgi:hypothetical protein